MKRAAQIALATLLLVGALPVPAPARPAAPASARLAGTTIFSGDRHGSTIVEIPKAVPLASLETDIMGSGRFRGLFLAKLDWDRDRIARPVFEVLQLGKCDSPGCDGAPLTTLTGWQNLNEVLPRGRYRAYLIADGGPTTVWLRSPVLSGRATIRPRDAATVELRTLPTRIEESRTRSVFSAGDWTPFPDVPAHKGQSFMALWVETEARVAGTKQGCYYANAPQSKTPADFGPGCPGADGFHVPYEIQPNPERSEDVVMVASTGLLHGLGGNYTTAGSVASRGAYALWIKF